MHVSLMLVVMSATTLLAQETAANGYEGCWEDYFTYRVLQYEVGSHFQNIQDCAVRCLGFTHFGMKDQDRCFCGNGIYMAEAFQRVREVYCDSPCRQPDNNGNIWICGASGHLSVYQTEDHYTYMEQFPDDPLTKLLVFYRKHLQTIRNGYYGCYRDASPHRVLSHEIGRGVRNIQDCAVRCLGFTYFGMEDEDHCFCGNQLEVTRSRERVNDNECQTFCSHPDYNNHEWICGAAGLISVYTTEDHYTYMERFPDDPLWRMLIARQHLQTNENGYEGCWQEGVDNRLLSHEIGTEVHNIQDCALWCLGYRYFGVEDRDTCFCDNRLDMSGSRVRVSDNDCDTFCTYPGYNNTEWICGASGRISVYNAQDHLTYMEQFPDDPLGKILYARQHLQTTEHGYDGCYQDGVDNRLLSVEIGRAVQHIHDCALWCLGYHFFGVEDGDVCFCGDQIEWSPSHLQVNDNECHTLCRRPGHNNTEWICGSPDRISVYRTVDQLRYMEQFIDAPLVETHIYFSMNSR